MKNMKIKGLKTIVSLSKLVNREEEDGFYELYYNRKKNEAFVQYCGPYSLYRGYRGPTGNGFFTCGCIYERTTMKELEGMILEVLNGKVGY